MKLGIFMIFALELVNIVVAKKYTLEYYLGAKGLPDKIYGYCEVWLRTGPNAFFQEGTTGASGLTKDPSWSERWTVDYTDGQDKELQFHIYASRLPTDDLIAGLKVNVLFLVEFCKFVVDTRYLLTTPKLQSLKGGDVGTLQLKFRIIKVDGGRSARSSAFRNHIICLPYYGILFLASLSYFLRI